jgi:hypothetical protein
MFESRAEVILNIVCHIGNALLTILAIITLLKNHNTKHKETKKKLEEVEYLITKAISKNEDKP